MQVQEIKFRATMDMSSIQQNAATLQKTLGKVRFGNVNDTLKYSQTVSKIVEATQKYVELNNKPDPSTKDMKERVRLGESLKKSYQEIGKLMSNIDLEQTAGNFEFDTTSINEAKQTVQTLGTSLTDTLKKLDPSQVKGSNILERIKEEASKAEPDIEEILKDLENLEKNQNKFKGDRATLVQSLIGDGSENKKTIEQLNAAYQVLNGTTEANVEATRQVVEENQLLTQENIPQNIDKNTQEFNKQDQAEIEAANNMDQLTQRLTYFISAANGLQMVRRLLQQTFNTIKELDSAMTEMAVVTESTVSDYWDQMPDYTEKAYELGSSIQDVYEASTLYYQQGLDTAQVTALTTSTMKMARIAGLEASEATDRMTNALRGFNMELTEANAQNVADVYSQLAAVSAADVDEISVAMTKTASIAHSANMEFETTAALLTQIIETTRESAETAGTALKTIIARFSEVKDLYSQGQLEGTDDEGEEINVNNVAKALSSVGINLNKYLTGAVGLDDIFLELASKWDTLDLVTQRYIATMAAGSRQQSRFIAMMQDYARTTELVSEAQNAAGASNEQFEKTLESLESKLNRLKTQWQSLTTTLIPSEVIKGVIDTGTQILSIINKITGNSTIAKFAVLAGAWKGLGKVIKVVSTELTRYQSIHKLTLQSKTQGQLDPAEAQRLATLKQEASLENRIATTRDSITAKTKSALLVGEKEKLLKQKNLEIEKLEEEIAIRGEALTKVEIGSEEEKILLKAQGLATDKLVSLEKEKQTILESGILKTKLVQFLVDKKILKYQEMTNAAGEVTQTLVLATLGYLLIAAATIAAFVVLLKAIKGDYLTKRIENTKEDLEEIQSSLEEVNSSLEETEERIAELQSKGHLTLVEQDELDNLKQQNQWLKIRQKLLEEDEKEEQDKLNKQSERLIGRKLLYQGGNVKTIKNNIADIIDSLDNMDEEYRQEYLSTEEGSQVIKLLMDYDYVDYNEAAQLLTGDSDFDFDSFITDAKPEELKEWAEKLGISEERLIEHQLALNDALETTSATIESVEPSVATITSALSSFEEVMEGVNSALEDMSENGYVGSSTLQDLKENFGDVSDFNDYAAIFVDPTKSYAEQKEALEGLVTAYIQEKNVLDNVTESNQALYVAELKQMGITNAQALVTEQLAHNEIELVEINENFESSLNRIAQKYGIASEELAKYRLQLILSDYDTFITTLSEQRDSLLKLAEAAGIASDSITALAKAQSLMNAYSSMSGSTKIISKAQYTKILKQAGADQRTIDRLNEKNYVTEGQVYNELVGLYNSQSSSVQAKLKAALKAETLSTSSSSSSASDIDPLYNYIQKASAYQEKLNQLQEEYNLLLEKGAKKAELLANKEQQATLLNDRKATLETLVEKRTAQLNSLNNSSKYKKYAQYITTNGAGMVQADITKIQAAANGDDIDDYLSTLEEYISDINDWVSEITSTEESILELYEDEKDAYSELEETILDALVSKIEDEIETLETINDSIKEVNEELLDSIQESIDATRQERDNQETESDITDLAQKIAYLQQDTTGANQMAILEAQKELNEKTEDYTDTLIDQKIDELKTQNDKAAEQREEQIQLLKDQLEYQQENGLLWDTVHNIISSGTNSEGGIIEGSLLYSLGLGDTLQSGSKLQIAEALEELVKNVLLASVYGSTTHYATGGLNTSTGPAWLDGTTSKPELVLNAEDTENFLKLKDVLSHAFNGASNNSSVVGDTYVNVSVQVDSLSNDYDVEQLVSKIKTEITNDAQYRNVNAINLMR